MKRIIFSLLAILAILVSVSPASVQAQKGFQRSLTESVTDLKLDTPLESTDVTPASLLDPKLVGAVGPQDVIVTLRADSVMQTAVNGGSVFAQRAQLRIVKVQQNGFLRDARKIDTSLKTFGAVQRVLNAVFVKVDGSKLAELSKNPAVLSIKPITNYQLDLAYAVPYVGGTNAHNDGYTGAGVKVGIIDTGVDYTHALLGGSGNVADYNANDPTIVEPGTFPTAKVVGGFDFVGETWPNTDLTPDPDPLDSKPAGGHGSHVSSIAAGLTGMAPDASLYVYKVCSSQRNTCSGAAMLQAIDASTDPNGDGITTDHLDVINMSIGSSYGQPYDDDTSKAVEMATMAGVLVVTSTGNSYDKPYIAGTPGDTPSALATAATNNPSGFWQIAEITAPASIVGAIGAGFQPWSAPLTSVIEAPVIYFPHPTTDPLYVTETLGCSVGANPNSTAAGTEPYPAGSLTGKIVLVDRGTCSASIKIFNIQRGGGLVGVIGMIAPGLPYTFAYGGGAPFTIPGYTITQSDATLIKSKLAEGVVLKFDPANVESLGGTIVDFSSRGPGQFPYEQFNEKMMNFIKPEIAAPGVLTAAAYGTGTGQVTMQGTSMASPMVCGAAALVKQAHPDLTGREIKALLVTSAYPDVLNNVLIFGGTPVPITRQGGGEVRVDQAINAVSAAWDTQTLQPSLSFSMVDAAYFVRTVTRHITIKNYSTEPITYKLTSTFRYQNDADNGAVTIAFTDNKLAEYEVTVPAGQTSAPIPVHLGIDTAKLQLWELNSGAAGASGDKLTKMEYDGFIWFDDVSTADDDAALMHMAWHVLPRLSGNVLVSSNNVAINTTDPAYGLPAGTTVLKNFTFSGAPAVGPAFIDVYSLLAQSPDLPEGAWGEQSPIVDLKNFGVATFFAPAGYCSDEDSFVLQFAINTWERSAHANVPAEFDVYLDTNQDGTPDYVVFTFDVGWSSGGYTTGNNVTWVYDLATNMASAWFYTNHSTNSSNFVLTLCGEQIGMNATNLYQNMDVSVYAYDWYHTGNLTDAIEGLVAAPMGERYGGIVDGDYGWTDLMGGEMKTLWMVDWGAAGTNPGELGLLLVNTAARGSYMSGAPGDNEATTLFPVYP
jgi:subtilisin family serine protease